jgi:preprotein translocase subunit SecG
MLEINVTSYNEINVGQRDAMVLFPEWREGDFVTAFHDLYLAADGLHSLEIEDVSKHLNANIGTSEIFEAFGMKVPAEQVTTWGTVIILAIQLYLYAYLKALKNPLQQSDPGWEVAWIGLNQSILSRCMLLVTVFILPLVAVVLLSAHGIDQRAQQAGIALGYRPADLRRALRFAHDFKAVLLYIFGCILATALGYLNWRNRPQLEMEPVQSRSQLFE